MWYPLHVLDQPSNCILRTLATMGVVSRALAEEYATEFPVGRQGPLRSYEGVFTNLGVAWTRFSEHIPDLNSGMWLWHKPSANGANHCSALYALADGYWEIDGNSRPVPLSRQSLRLYMLHRERHTT